MKPFISKTFYGVINYTVAILLILSPFIFGFTHVTIAAGLLVPLYLGWLQLIMSIFSDNPLGFLKVFPMQMQNLIDVLMGSFLLGLPWLYAFSSEVFWPHLILGSLLVIKGLFAVQSPFLTPAHRSLPEGGITSIDSSEGRLNV